MRSLHCLETSGTDYPVTRHRIPERRPRRMRWVGHVTRMGEGIGVHRVLAGKSEGKIPLGRPRRRWEDNIKMDLQEVGLGCVD